MMYICYNKHCWKLWCRVSRLVLNGYEKQGISQQALHASDIDSPFNSVHAGTLLSARENRHSPNPYPFLF